MIRSDFAWISLLHHAMSSFIYRFLFLLMYSSSCSYQQSPDDHRIIRTLEKLPVHTEVVNLRQLFLPNHPAESAATADFMLAKRDEYPYLYFLINHSSRGILTIRKEIDRDQLCRLRRCRCDTWCDLELEIFVNHEQFHLEVLTIRVLDQNDHRPQFSTLSEQLQVTIVENAPVGARIKLESAIDQDQGDNGIVDYSLVSSVSLPFSLRYDLTRADLSLVVEQLLDREMTSSYTFDIVARDGSNQTGTLRVHVTIDDVNDSPPKFDQSIYRWTNISEYAQIDAVLGRIHAQDNDTGVNGEMTYHLLNDEPCFVIDETTGDVRLRCLLDYETKRSYRLHAEVRDQGEGAKTDFCTILIDLRDENDHAPSIDFYPSDLPIDNQTVIVSLSESVPIHSLVLSFAIIDHDSGENGRVTWKLDRSSFVPFELIRLTENTGELRSKQLLDRESTADYNFTLEAVDHGRPAARLTRLPIRILLLDENDHRPKFRQEQIRTTISEHVQFNDQVGYEVYRLQADDQDQGLNGEVLYSIVNNMTDRFRIDAKTGVIRAMKGFDRQEQDTFLLHVRAEDRGSPSLYSETTVMFTIVARNQHAPVCQSSNDNQSWPLMENSLQGTIVGTFVCSDGDEQGPNAQLSVDARWWPEEPSAKGTIPFQVITRRYNLSETAIEILISINGSIDRETISSYPLLLTVSDHGNPSFGTNRSLSIDILDENDNCPELHLENPFIMLNRDHRTTDPFVLHLLASDQDHDSNGEITFELSPSTSPSFVHLHPNGTMLVQTRSPVIPDDSLFVLHVQIRDHGQPTPCLIVETLRLFIGSNRTDWARVSRHHQQRRIDDEAALRLATQASVTDRHSAHAHSTRAISIASSKHFLFIMSFAKRKRLFIVFVALSILSAMILIAALFCLVDRSNRTIQRKKSSLKSNGLLHQSPYQLANGKRIAKSSPPGKLRHGYDGDNESPTHNYTSLKCLQPIVVVASSSSPSSSLDSTTRSNTTQNRTMNSTYTYTAIGTTEELTPLDFDDPQVNLHSDVELMMTTV